MIMDYTTLKCGDLVAVARPGSWGVMNEGNYIVVKANKMKVVVERASDRYQREFSVKRRCEAKSTDRYHAPYLELPETQAARIERRNQEVAKRQAWSAVETAAVQKDIAALRRAVAALEEMLDPVPF